MDGLALLCNLFADGPASLRSLRSIGIRSLNDVLVVPEASLASTLKTSRAHVRRFQCEARGLQGRLAEMPLEPELRPTPGADPAAKGVLAPIHPLTFTGRRTPQAYELQPLDAERDEPLSEAPQPVAERAPDVEASAEEAPPAPASPERVLQRGELPGLDSQTCEALVREGVRTYRALIELASLGLARRVGIPFTRLLDLRYAAEGFLARPDVPGSATDTDLEPVRDIATPSPAPAPTTGKEPIVVVVPQARRARAPDTEEATPFRFEVRTPDAPIEHSLERDDACEDPGVSGPFV